MHDGKVKCFVTFLYLIVFYKSDVVRSYFLQY